MGKRKRSADLNKTPPPQDLMPQSPEMNYLPRQKQLNSLDMKHVKDSSVNLQGSPVDNQNSGQTVSLRPHRQYYGRQYSRRSSANKAETSSHSMGTTSCDEKASFKLESKHLSDSEHPLESKEKGFLKPDRQPNSRLATGPVSTDPSKLVCGICKKFLRKKAYSLGNPMSSGDHSVVAVLVCGHLYHADCLEERTSHDDLGDPPCPLCVGQISEAEPSMAED